MESNVCSEKKHCRISVGAIMPEEQDWIENLKTIREYLAKQFPGFVMTEDSSDTGILHKFTMTNPQTHEQLKLKVGWPRLSDKSNNPEKTERALVHGDVARKMRQQKGQYFYW
jgi:hypothetical protein